MYFRYQLSGTLGGIEVFTVNPVFDVEGELSDSWLQETANAMITAAGAVDVPEYLRELGGQATQYTEVRLEGRSSSNDALLGVAVASYTGAQNTTTPTARQVPQAAVVISLRTDSPGASGRGRLFWPAIGASVGSTLRLISPTPAEVAADAATYLNDVRLAMEAAATSLPPWSSLQLAVRSKTTQTTPHVQRVQVGDIIDTQRRRRDALPENYTTSVFPPAE